MFMGKKGQQESEDSYGDGKGKQPGHGEEECSRPDGELVKREDDVDKDEEEIRLNEARKKENSKQANEGPIEPPENHD